MTVYVHIVLCVVTMKKNNVMLCIMMIEYHLNVNHDQSLDLYNMIQNLYCHSHHWYCCLNQNDILHSYILNEDFCMNKCLYMEHK